MIAEIRGSSPHFASRRGRPRVRVCPPILRKLPCLRKREAVSCGSRAAGACKLRVAWTNAIRLGKRPVAPSSAHEGEARNHCHAKNSARSCARRACCPTLRARRRERLRSSCKSRVSVLIHDCLGCRPLGVDLTGKAISIDSLTCCSQAYVCSVLCMSNGGGRNCDSRCRKSCAEAGSWYS